MSLVATDLSSRESPDFDIDITSFFASIGMKKRFIITLGHFLNMILSITPTTTDPSKMYTSPAYMFVSPVGNILT
jgi:hypothetical protein